MHLGGSLTIIMIANVQRYKIRVPKRKKRRIVLIFVLISIAIVVGIFGFLKILKGSELFESRFEKQLSLMDLWNNRSYDDIISRCDEILRKNPLDRTALAFKGFSYFYGAISEISLEEKIPLIDQAIIALRRAKLSGDERWEGEIQYILGKAYYHKGKYYYDLAIHYLEASLQSKFMGEDTYEYLGVAYTKLGDVLRGTEWLKKVVDQEKSDLVLLAISQNYLQLEQYENAEIYLLRALDNTEDPMIVENCRLALGGMYLENKRFDDAKMHYENILEMNPESADAHYFLGEVYLGLGDPVRARAEWRDALILDPSHYAAKLRYYK